MLGTYLLGVQTGLAVAVPFGPLNMEISRRCLRDGWRSGFAVGLGAVTIDFLYILATGLGLAPLMQHRAVTLVVFLVGGFLLGRLAWAAVKDGWESWRGRNTRAQELAALAPAGAAPEAALRAYGIGLAMTAFSPMTIAFWATVPQSVVFAGRVPEPREVFIVGVGVLTGCLAWVLFFTGVLSALRSRIGARFFAAVSVAGGLLILAVALRFVWQALRMLAGAA
ncbi:MAG: LysE family transporter [Candidatus Sumerlaeia bacterium]|nr:LysE family transporter [Candidatus Sumerlaeia bacterium]